MRYFDRAGLFAEACQEFGFLSPEEETNSILASLGWYGLLSLVLSLGSPANNGRISYCSFHKHANSEVQKPTDDCFLRCRQSKVMAFVFLFQGSLLVIVIMVDGSEKRNCEGGL